jgi:hypothetical protein
MASKTVNKLKDSISFTSYTDSVAVIFGWFTFLGKWEAQAQELSSNMSEMIEKAQSLRSETMTKWSRQALETLKPLKRKEDSLRIWVPICIWKLILFLKIFFFLKKYKSLYINLTTEGEEQYLYGLTEEILKKLIN